MRAQREKVQLLKDSGAGEDEVMLARCKYQAQLNEYSRYCKKMNLPEQRQRIYYDMRGRVAPSNVARKSKIRYNQNSTTKITDDWKDKTHARIPKNYFKNAVIETREKKGNSVQINRTFYDEKGQMRKQIHSGNHKNPKQHPYGINGEHAHDYEWKDDKIVNRTTRELDEGERRENNDII